MINRTVTKTSLVACMALASTMALAGNQALEQPLAAAAQATQTSALPAQAAKAQGAALLLPFKKQLKGALMAGMKQGPEAAVAACNEQAPGIAASLSQQGVAVGRSSHKLRNPDNAAAQWLAPVIAEFVAGATLEPRLVTLADGRQGYVEPIKLQPVCTTCHGEQLAPAIAERIHALYPSDQATGFKAGDFRGVFWATFNPDTIN